MRIAERCNTRQRSSGTTRRAAAILSGRASPTPSWQRGIAFCILGATEEAYGHTRRQEVVRNDCAQPAYPSVLGQSEPSPLCQEHHAPRPASPSRVIVWEESSPQQVPMASSSCHLFDEMNELSARRWTWPGPRYVDVEDGVRMVNGSRCGLLFRFRHDVCLDRPRFAWPEGSGLGIGAHLAGSCCRLPMPASSLERSDRVLAATQRSLKGNMQWKHEI